MTLSLFAKNSILESLKKSLLCLLTSPVSAAEPSKKDSVALGCSVPFQGLPKAQTIETQYTVSNKREGINSFDMALTEVVLKPGPMHMYLPCKK